MRLPVILSPGSWQRQDIRYLAGRILYKKKMSVLQASRENIFPIPNSQYSSQFDVILLPFKDFDR
jgi:hypothetical protein